MNKKNTSFLFCFLMSYFTLTKTVTDPFINLSVSVFGDLIVGERVDDINIQFQYGIPDDFTAEATANGGTVTETDSMAVISSGADVNGQASLTSLRSLIYVPGHQGFVFFTALFTTVAENSTQWIGLFDADDGWAVGFNNIDFSILYRRDGDSDTIINQASFNVDILNGAGPSGMTLYYTKLNVFRIGYGWLGASTINFSVLREDGEWILFHVIQRPNNFTGPSVINPILPIKAEIIKTGSDATDLQLKTASWNAGRVDPRSSTYSRTYALQLVDATPDAATPRPLITIRNKTTFKGKTNRSEVTLIFVGASNANVRSRFSIVKNPTITLYVSPTPPIPPSQTYTDVDTNSCVEYVLFDSTLQFPEYDYGPPSTGQSFMTLLVDTDGQANIFPKANDLFITLLPGDVLSIICNKQSASGDVDTSITWQELF